MSYWKRLACVLPVLLLANAGFAAKPAPKPAAPQQPVPQTIRAQRIELTDDKGNVRVVIGIGTEGEAIIKLLDKNGKPTVALRSDDGLGILNEDGKPKIVAGAAGAGYGISVFDSKGKPRCTLTIVDDEPYLAMSDSNGKFRASMLLIKDQPFISLTDGKDNGAYVSLKVKGSSPQLLLTDASGKARSEYSLADDGTPRLLMANSTGTSSLQLLLSNDIPSIDLSYPNGNPAATMTISEGKGFLRTSDSDNLTVWHSP
jgi:hypothetical protein